MTAAWRVGFSRDLPQAGEGFMGNLYSHAENHKGFTLIEIAIVMVIIGLLAGGGISLMGVLTKRKARNQSIDYLKQAKEALTSYANIHGAPQQVPHQVHAGQTL